MPIMATTGHVARWANRKAAAAAPARRTGRASSGTAGIRSSCVATPAATTKVMASGASPLVSRGARRMAAGLMAIGRAGVAAGVRRCRLPNPTLAEHRELVAGVEVAGDLPAVDVV